MTTLGMRVVWHSNALNAAIAAAVLELVLFGLATPKSMHLLPQWEWRTRSMNLNASSLVASELEQVSLNTPTVIVFFWIPSRDVARYMKPAPLNVVLGRFGTATSICRKTGHKLRKAVLAATRDAYILSMRFGAP